MKASFNNCLGKIYSIEENIEENIKKVKDIYNIIDKIANNTITFEEIKGFFNRTDEDYLSLIATNNYIDLTNIYSTDITDTILNNSNFTASNFILLSLEKFKDQKGYNDLISSIVNKLKDEYKGYLLTSLNWESIDEKIINGLNVENDREFLFNILNSVSLDKIKKIVKNNEEKYKNLLDVYYNDNEINKFSKDLFTYYLSLTKELNNKIDLLKSNKLEEKYVENKLKKDPNTKIEDIVSLEGIENFNNWSNDNINLYQTKLENLWEKLPDKSENKDVIASKINEIELFKSVSNLKVEDGKAKIKDNKTKNDSDKVNYGEIKDKIGIIKQLLTTNNLNTQSVNEALKGLNYKGNYQKLTEDENFSTMTKQSTMDNISGGFGGSWRTNDEGNYIINFLKNDKNNYHFTNSFVSTEDWNKYFKNGFKIKANGELTSEQKQEIELTLLKFKLDPAFAMEELLKNKHIKIVDPTTDQDIEAEKIQETIEILGKLKTIMDKLAEMNQLNNNIDWQKLNEFIHIGDIGYNKGYNCFNEVKDLFISEYFKSKNKSIDGLVNFLNNITEMYKCFTLSYKSKEDIGALAKEFYNYVKNNDNGSFQNFIIDKTEANSVFGTKQNIYYINQKTLISQYNKKGEGEEEEEEEKKELAQRVMELRKNRLEFLAKVEKYVDIREKLTEFVDNYEYEYEKIVTNEEEEEIDIFAEKVNLAIGRNPSILEDEIDGFEKKYKILNGIAAKIEKIKDKNEKRKKYRILYEKLNDIVEPINSITIEEEEATNEKNIAAINKIYDEYFNKNLSDTTNALKDMEIKNPFAQAIE